MAENNYEEKKLEEVTTADLVRSLEILASAVESLNAVQLVILHNMKDLKMPEWESFSDIENDVAGKVIECIDAVKKVTNGQHKTDKS